MSAPYRPSLRDISTEMYGNPNQVGSLRAAFENAGGTFDPAYAIAGSDRQSEFSNYENFTFSKDTDSWYADNTAQSSTVNCTSTADSGSTLSVDPGDSWITVSPSSGLYGDFSFDITLEENTTGYDRSAMVYINYGGNTIDTIYTYQYA